MQPISTRDLFSTLLMDTQSRLSILPKLGPAQMIENYLHTPGELRFNNTRQPKEVHLLTQLGRDIGQRTDHTQIAFDTNGDLVFCDRDNNLVQVLRTVGTHVRTIGLGRLLRAESVAIGPDNRVYVGDINGVKCFNGHNGAFLHEWASPTTVRAYLPQTDTDGNKIAVTADGNVLVLGQKKCGYVFTLFSPNGDCIRQWEPEQCPSPNNVSINPKSGLIAVCSAYSVHIFNSDYEHLQTIGSKGDVDGQLFLATNVATDAVGNVVVSDAYGVQVFNCDGTFRCRIGPREYSVRGLGIDIHGRVFVSESSNCITVWE